jgi:hypothetical protein
MRLDLIDEFAWTCTAKDVERIAADADHPPVGGVVRFRCRVLPTYRRIVEVPGIMRALRPDVVDAVWTAVAARLPPPDRSHPLDWSSTTGR